MPGRDKAALPKSPTDLVTLGKTGIQVSLVGMGTGSIGSGQASNQTRLGVKEFTRVVRHALDHGVRFFDVADQYGSHVYLREALKGVPRDQYVIQTKTHATDLPNAKSHLERYRLELGVDYIDIVLLHCMQKTGWPAENQGSMEYLMKAKEEKIIRAHGTSCHGMDPLHVSAKNPFVEIDLARINPEGLIMDDRKPDEVASVLEEMHNAGKGSRRDEDPGERADQYAGAERRIVALRARSRHGRRVHHRVPVNGPDRRHPQADGRRDCVLEELTAFDVQFEMIGAPFDMVKTQQAAGA